MEKRFYTILSVILLLLGLFFINIEVTIVGAVIGVPSLFSFNSIIGLSLILLSGVLFVTKEGLEEKIRSHGYFHRRMRELTKYRGDAWVSQWEYKGVVNELEKAGYEIEHGKRRPAIHIGGKGPNIKHIYIQKGKEVGKHIYITPDPRDPRVRQIGFKEKQGKVERILSKVYHPKHPRKSIKEKVEIS